MLDFVPVDRDAIYLKLGNLGYAGTLEDRLLSFYKEYTGLSSNDGEYLEYLCLTDKAGKSPATNRLGKSDLFRLYNSKGLDIDSVFSLFKVDDVPQYEADALIAFYNSGNGDNWSDNTGWKTDPIVGNWAGITVSGSRVTKINLSGDGNITGNIKHLQTLTNLTLLNLNSTAATGDIVILQNLTNLVYLYLHKTAVTGDIAVLQNLISLEYLRLYSTAVTGDIVIFQSLTDLERLHLHYTAVTGNAFIIQFLPNLSGTNSWEGFRLNNTNVSSYTQGTIPTLTCYINISSLGLSQTEIDNFLVDMDNSGSTGCPIDVSGNSAPSQTGLDAIASLEGKGCTITYDT